MATRSRIAIENNDGSVTSIYCHWDGYPSHNGEILVLHYKERKKVQKLIDLGSISLLAPRIETSLKHSFQAPVKGVVVAYHRDRGENLVQKNHRNKNSYFESDIEEWGYLFTLEGEWLVKGYGSFEIQKLASLLSGYE
jgi:hypothetical protein